METSKKQRSTLTIIVLILVAAVAALVVVLLITQRTANEKVNKFIDDQLAMQAEELASESDYIEDGYFVSDIYEIKSTTAISDAYISNDTSALSDEDLETLEMASDVLDRIITPDMTTDYAKELAVYDWMVENISNGNSTTISKPGLTGNDAVSTPHGVLKGKNAICVGYATTFRLLVNMLGMDCHIAHSDYHSWDLVQLDDDQWYYVDTYSDAGDVKYANFNMTESMCQEQHDWAGSSSLPTAEGVEYTYANQNCIEVEDYTKIPKELMKAAGKANGSFISAYKLFNLDEETISEVSFMAQLIQSASENGEIYEFSSGYLQFSWVPYDDTTMILQASYSDYSSSYSPSSDLNEEIENNIYDIVNSAFGTSLSSDSLYGGYYEGEYSDDTGAYYEEEDLSDDAYADEDGK